MNSQKPLARQEKLVVRELADEVLVYDLARDKAYCLNPIAGAVWKHSDGQTSAGQIAERVSLQLGATVEEQAVWTAIEQLGRDHLLEYCISAPSGVTRREHLKSFGKAAAIAGPMVAALAVPKGAAGAQSCLNPNKPCTPGGIPCCKGACKQNGNSRNYACPSM